MNELQGLFSLSHKISIIIPSKEQNGKAIPESRQKGDTLETMRLFSDFFGGATSYEAMGAWNSTTTGISTEKTTIVEAYATKEAVEEHIHDVLSLAKAMKKQCNQESIALVYNNVMYFI